MLLRTDDVTDDDDSLRPNGVGGCADVGDGIVKVAVTILLRSSSTAASMSGATEVQADNESLRSLLVAVAGSMLVAALPIEAADRLVGVGGALIV